MKLTSAIVKKGLVYPILSYILADLNNDFALNYHKLVNQLHEQLYIRYITVTKAINYNNLIIRRQYIVAICIVSF